eukprot:4144406-Amphidinium_carterae.1
MSAANLHRMQIGAAPGVDVASGFVVVDGTVNKRPKELDTVGTPTATRMTTIVMISTRLRKMHVTAAAATTQGAARSREMIRAGDEMHIRKGQMDGTLNGVHLHL